MENKDKYYLALSNAIINLCSTSKCFLKKHMRKREKYIIRCDPNGSKLGKSCTVGDSSIWPKKRGF